jgi:dTDP-glucose pyrophosphorylase
MKALILAGGRGKRLNEHTTASNKCMLRINGRPVIENSLEHAISSGADEIIIVVGHKAEEIINAYGTSYKDKKIIYVIQWEQKGLVHAIECAKQALDGEDFILLLGDEIMINPRHRELVKEFKNNDIFILCGILDVDDRELIKRTYTIIQNEDNQIYRLIEKPKQPLNNFMGTGDCVFKNEIINYIDVTPIHHERFEKELPDLIQCAIDDGKNVKSFIVCDYYTNINAVQDIEYAMAILSGKRGANL